MGNEKDALYDSAATTVVIREDLRSRLKDVRKTLKSALHGEDDVTPLASGPSTER